MPWFFIAVSAPFLWAVTNHIDKHILDKHIKRRGVGAFIIVSTLLSLVLLPFIWFFRPEVLDIAAVNIVWMLLSGLFLTVYLIPYLKALMNQEASIVVPMFQMIPVFSYFLSFFILGEALTARQLIAGAVIILASAGLSLDLREKIRLKKDVLGLMIAASALAATGAFLFRYVVETEGYWTTVFWEFVGFGMAVVLLLYVKNTESIF